MNEIRIPAVPVFERIRGRYYAIREVERYLDEATAVMEQLRDSREQLLRQVAEKDAALREQAEHIRLLEDTQMALKRDARLKRDQALREQETRVAQAEREGEERLLAARSEMEQRMAQLRQELDARPTAEKSGALVLAATKQASDLLDEARDQRDTLLKSTQEQCTRSLAASRAIYYNGLQFKQDLARQFREMELELDRSLNALRDLDGVTPMLGNR